MIRTVFIFVIAFLPFLLQAQEHDLLRKKYQQFSADGQSDSALLYAKKVKAAAIKEYGTAAMPYYRAMNNLGVCYFEGDFKNTDSAKYWWLRALHESENNNDANVLVTKNYLYNNLSELYVIDLPRADSAIYYSDLFLSTTPNKTDKDFLNSISEKAGAIEGKFGLPAAEKYYQQALNVRETIFGRNSRMIIAGIDSILRSYPATNTPGRRQRLYMVLEEDHSLGKLDKLSLQYLNDADSWKAISYAVCLMDKGLKAKGGKSKEFFTGLHRAALAYHRWLKEDEIALFCLQKGIEILHGEQMGKSRFYAEMAKDIAEIKQDVPKIVQAEKDNLQALENNTAASASGPQVTADGLRLMLPIAHPWGIRYAEFSPDGKYVCSRSFNDVNAKIWDVATGALLYNLPLSSYVYGVVFSPDSRSVAVTSAKEVAVWGLEDGTKRWLHRTDKEILARTFSGDGKFLYVGESEYLATLEAATGKVLKREKFDSGIRDIITANETSVLLIFNYKDGSRSIINYQPATGKQQSIVDKGHRAWISYDKMAVLFKEDAVIYDLPSLKIVNIINVLDTGIVNGALSLDGEKLMFSYRADSSRAVFDTKTGSNISYYSFGYLPTNMVFMPDDKYYIIRENFDYIASIFEAKTGNLVEEIFGDTSSLSYNVSPFINFSHDNKYMLTVFGDNAIRIWDITGKKITQVKELAGKTRPLSGSVLSPDGNQLAATCADGYVKIFDLAMGTITGSVKHEAAATAHFSPGMDLLFTESPESIAVWELPSLKKLKEINTPGLRSIDINKTSDLIATASIINGNVKLINWRTGRSEEVFKADSVGFVKFDASNQKLLIGIQNKGFGVFNPGTKKFDFNVQLPAWFFSIDYCNNGKYIVTTESEKIRIFNSANGDLINAFDILNDVGTMGYAITADGKSVISGDQQGTLNIWDIVSGKLLKTIKAHNAGFEPRLTENDERLVTVSSDGIIKIWDFKSLQPLYDMIPIEEGDYLVYTPSGYYKSSPASAKYLHYITKDKSIVGFDQLDVKYNRPDLVLGMMGNADTSLIKSYRLAYEKRIKRLGIDTTSFSAGFSLPAADFADRANMPTEQSAGLLKLHITGRDSVFTLDRFNIWVNDSPLFGLNGISLRSRKLNHLDTTLTIRLSQGRNVIETSVTNINGTESYRKPLFVNYLTDTIAPGKVWFVGIGVAKFADTTKNLKWSATDIKNLDSAFRTKYAGQYHSYLLLNEEVTKEGIARVKKILLDSTGVNDKVIVSYSGHGILSKDMDYYLSTYAVDFNKPEEKGVAYDVLESLMDGIAARRKLMLIDACNSGEIDKDEVKKTGTKAGNSTKGIEVIDYGVSKSAFELMQEIFINVGRGTGTTVISASNGTQPAYEKNDLKGGVFTYSLLQKLKEDKPTKISELKRHLGLMVSEITAGKQKPTIRSTGNLDDWTIWE